MESMGGALFVDGEWESLCKLFSTEQDLSTDHLLGYNSNPPKSHLTEDEDLISLIMGNTVNPISSSFFTQEANLAPNSNQLPQSCSSDLSCDSSNGGSPHYVNGFNNLVQPNANEDQISCLYSFDCFLEEGLMMGQLGVPDVIDREAGDHPSAAKRNSMEAEVPKKRARVSKLAGTRKMRNEDVEEETNGDSNVQNLNGDISDNESNDSQEIIDEKPKEILNMNGKRRANRGAATDPQSLYARRRRERINERLRILQSLVPNGTKVDISTMLEEAVNYVKFLQLQIKLLSSDEMWMYAPLAYSGFDMGLYKRFSPYLPRP